MVKLGILASLLSIATVVGIASTPTVNAEDTACVQKKFDTALAKDACAKGGQKAAKDAMKAFMKDAKKSEADITCNSCHTKLAPNYELKKDALEHFKKLGGK